MRLIEYLPQDGLHCYHARASASGRCKRATFLRPDVAMTGELSLMGKVLKAQHNRNALKKPQLGDPQVGGIQEKARCDPL